MPWFKVDDKSHSHAKVIDAGNAAWGALVRLGAWASDHLTDGEIPRAVAQLFATSDELERLLSIGLLLRNNDGSYSIHDFLDWNPSAREVATRRKVRAKAGALGGKRTAEARRLTVMPGTDEQKKRARMDVTNAIKAGTLVPQPCEECGDFPTHAHHDDYTKPLDVRWLCPSHHTQFHISTAVAPRSAPASALATPVASDMRVAPAHPDMRVAPAHPDPDPDPDPDPKQDLRGAATPLREPPSQNGKTTDADFEAECARAAAVAEAKRAERRTVARPAPLSAADFQILEGKKS